MGHESRSLGVQFRNGCLWSGVDSRESPAPEGIKRRAGPMAPLIENPVTARRSDCCDQTTSWSANRSQNPGPFELPRFLRLRGGPRRRAQRFRQTDRRTSQLVGCLPESAQNSTAWNWAKPSGSDANVRRPRQPSRCFPCSSGQGPQNRNLLWKPRDHTSLRALAQKRSFEPVFVPGSLRSR